MLEISGRWGASSLGGYLVYKDQVDVVRRMVTQTNRFPCVFWEVWVFIPKEDTFYIFSQNCFQKCSVPLNKDFLKKDLHFALMSKPVPRQLIPWDTLPEGSAPRGLHGVSLFIQEKSHCIGYAKLGLGNKETHSRLIQDGWFLEELSAYKIALQKEMTLFAAGYSSEGITL